jgi:succinoglycan biosynthesis protein ExoM
MPTLISIGMCTLRRPSLARTLASIRNQRLPERMSLEVVVVDNDQAGSAEPVVTDFAAQVLFEVRYSIEPRGGLSSARNRVLSLARGDWIALIDDDETAEPDWLTELISCARRFEAQGVVGRVCPQYEAAAAPSWVADSGVFDLWLPATGTRIGADDALSGNALLDARFLRAHSLRFNEAFNSTGGEDTDFFARLIECGGLVVSSREAVVHEIIGRDRMTPEYLVRRSLRVGEIHARVSDRKGFARSRDLARAALYVCAAAALLVVHLPLGRRSYYRYRLALARNVGKLRFYFGMTPIEMYGSGFGVKENEVHASG